MNTVEQLIEIGKRFHLPGEFYSMSEVKTGNINRTYKVTYAEEQDDTRRMKSYVFQRINSVVFKDPVAIMRNIDLVTAHIRERFPNETTLHFHHCENGLNYVFTEDGAMWRVMNFVQDSISLDSCDDLSVIAMAGEAFGHFQMQLADFDGSLLQETIPDFHTTHKRLEKLFLDAEQNPGPRLAEARREMEYIAAVRDQAEEVSRRFANGDFPVRVTHNDTKLNNVLFDRVTHRPIVVIDLDTVMPGLGLNDFADAVRFIANTAAEDEPDTSLVSFDTEKFRAFCKGFIGMVKHAWTREEIENLVPATFAITVELAARFLDDYLTGDTYFKTEYPTHNLVRTRCQLALSRDISRKATQLQAIVRREYEREN